jgi:outer membrane biosynthesis protein TonB
MIEPEHRNILTGIVGTIAFHLLLLVVFLITKIGNVKNEHKEPLMIEFADQEYKTIEQIIEERKPKQEPIEQLSNQTLSNIASNTADKMNEEISTDKYIQEVMQELGMEEINPQYDNTLPQEDVISSEKKKPEDVKTNFGQTRITYNVPGRKGRHIERPIYRCQGGGTVVVKISVDQSGFVIQSVIKSSTASEECVQEMALESAQNSTFSSDYQGPKKVEGTITYIFVAQ